MIPSLEKVSVTIPRIWKHGFYIRFLGVGSIGKPGDTKKNATREQTIAGRRMIVG